MHSWQLHPRFICLQIEMSYHISIEIHLQWHSIFQAKPPVKLEMPVQCQCDNIFQNYSCWAMPKQIKAKFEKITTKVTYCNLITLSVLETEMSRF